MCAIYSRTEIGFQINFILYNFVKIIYGIKHQVSKYPAVNVIGLFTGSDE